MKNGASELLLELLSKESSPTCSTYSVSTQTSGRQECTQDEFYRNVSCPLRTLPRRDCVELDRDEDDNPEKWNGVIVGTLVNINHQEQPLVDFPGNPYLAPVQARFAVHLDKSNLGQDLVLVFQQGDVSKPIIIGFLHSPKTKPTKKDKAQELTTKQQIHVGLDGERLTFCAEKEIVLKCGKASITLTKAGKILIRGTYLLSRSSGVNRIKGGVVHVN